MTATATATESVRFESNGLTIAADLHRPGTVNGTAVVVGHPGSGVKEQTAGLYARRLAEHGYTALAFDAAYQGESGGTPRGLEDPAQRVEDFKAAVSYLASRDDVDAERIGALGICASGGYGLAAFATDQRLRCLATVSAVDMGRQWRVGPDGTQPPAAFHSLLEAAAGARTREARGDGVQTFDVFPPSVDDARRLGGDHAAEGYEYYRTSRGEHRNARAELPWTSIDRIGMFDAFAHLELIGARPLFMAVGTRAVTGWMSVEAYQRVTGPKQLAWIEGASHVDLYDRAQYVDPLVGQLDAFFGRTLT